VAFSDAGDGDMRGDEESRLRLAAALGIPGRWATVRQVHGAVVLGVRASGDHGEADAMWTGEPGLPLAVLTADCVGVVLHADTAVGVAHAGWRGTEARVVARLRSIMEAAGHSPTRAAIGPGIGPCCFEVGPDVADRFEALATTTWGSTSVDLVEALSDDLVDLEVWSSGACTRHEARWYSHREDGTANRMAALGWLT
jgi:YfiH family protein